jgi:hypothetical protein
MPKKIEPQAWTDGTADALRRAFERAGITDLDSFTADAIAAGQLHRAELLERIPELTAESVMRYTAAVAAAIVGEAISPDVGRAMLYAAQLAIAARPRVEGAAAPRVNPRGR